jgi:hypothetical protein
MDKKVFEKMQAHVFDQGNPWDIWANGSRKPNRLPYFSSWAIWNDSDIEDSSIIKAENASRLNPGIVFVALNFGSPLPVDWRDWQNIRGVKRVYKLLRGTRFEGAYITDMIKNHPVSNQNILFDRIRKGEIDIEANIKAFFEEMDLLGADNIEMYLFGVGVENLFREYVMRHPKFPEFSRKLKKVQRFHHYSMQVVDFEKVAPTQLGLASNPNAKIYPPLWPVPVQKSKPVGQAAAGEKSKPVQGTDSLVPLKEREERMVQLRSFLANALSEKENQNRGIRFRQIKGGDNNIRYTYLMFGTEKMDGEYPQGKDQAKGTFRDGHKYCYCFSFDGGDRMIVRFLLGHRDQDQETIKKMSAIYEKYNPKKTPPKDFGWKTQSFTSDIINLNAVFTYEAVLKEVNRIINDILKWEDSFPFGKY